MCLLPNIFLGKNLESLVGQQLGLAKPGAKGAKGTVKHLYFVLPFFNFLVSITLARLSDQVFDLMIDIMRHGQQLGRKMVLSTKHRGSKKRAAHRQAKVHSHSISHLLVSHWLRRIR